MMAFKVWLDNIEKEYPKYQDSEGYNIGNIRALKVGWKGALRWVLQERKTWGKGFDDCVFDMIKEELSSNENKE